MRSESLMVQYVAVRCSVLQFVSACESALQCVAVCCSELQAYDFTLNWRFFIGDCLVHVW